MMKLGQKKHENQKYSRLNICQLNIMEVLLYGRIQLPHGTILLTALMSSGTDKINFFQIFNLYCLTYTLLT